MRRKPALSSKGLPMTALDQWLAALRPVTHGSTRASVNTAWRLLDCHPDPQTWTAADMELVLALFRPAKASLREFLADHDLPDDIAMVCERRLQQDGTGAGDLTRPTLLFSIDMGVDGGCVSWDWALTATALTGDRALLCERAEHTLPQFPSLLGIVERSDLYRSAAVVLASRREKDRGRFKEDHFFHRLSVTKIAPIEAYRLLLARAGLGRTAIADMNVQALARFRGCGMECGYDEVRQLIGAGALDSRKARRR
jgi:hypothetical protein